MRGFEPAPLTPHQVRPTARLRPAGAPYPLPQGARKGSRHRRGGAAVQHSPFSPCGRRWPSEARPDEGFRAGESVDRLAGVIPATLSFHSPFTIFPFTFLHASCRSSIIPGSSSHGNTDHDGDCVGRDRRLRWAASVAGRPGRSCRKVFPGGTRTPACRTEAHRPRRDRRPGRRSRSRRQGRRDRWGAVKQAGSEIAGRAAARSHIIY